MQLDAGDGLTRTAFSVETAAVQSSNNASSGLGAALSLNGGPAKPMSQSLLSSDWDKGLAGPPFRDKAAPRPDEALLELCTAAVSTEKAVRVRPSPASSCMGCCSCCAPRMSLSCSVNSSSRGPSLAVAKQQKASNQ